MIFGAIDSGVENLCVVPVGLDYENYYTYRKELLVIYGEPIEISFGANLTTFEKAKAQTIVTEKIREGLSQVMIDIKNDDVYHEILLLKPISDKLCKSRSQAEQFAAFKNLKHISKKPSFECASVYTQILKSQFFLAVLQTIFLSSMNKYTIVKKLERLSFVSVRRARERTSVKTLKMISQNKALFFFIHLINRCCIWCFLNHHYIGING